MSDYLINFGARKGETLVKEKSTAKSQQQNCTTKPIESTDWNPMHPINFKSLSFAVPSSETRVFTCFDISRCQKCATFANGPNFEKEGERYLPGAGVFLPFE